MMHFNRLILFVSVVATGSSSSLDEARREAIDISVEVIALHAVTGGLLQKLKESLESDGPAVWGRDDYGKLSMFTSEGDRLYKRASLFVASYMELNAEELVGGDLIFQLCGSMGGIASALGKFATELRYGLSSMTVSGELKDQMIIVLEQTADKWNKVLRRSEALSSSAAQITTTTTTIAPSSTMARTTLSPEEIQRIIDELTNDFPEEKKGGKNSNKKKKNQAAKDEAKKPTAPGPSAAKTKPSKAEKKPNAASAVEEVFQERPAEQSVPEGASIEVHSAADKDSSSPEESLPDKKKKSRRKKKTSSLAEEEVKESIAFTEVRVTEKDPLSEGHASENTETSDKAQGENGVAANEEAESMSASVDDRSAEKDLIPEESIATQESDESGYTVVARKGDRKIPRKQEKWIVKGPSSVNSVRPTTTTTEEIQIVRDSQVLVDEDVSLDQQPTTAREAVASATPVSTPTVQPQVTARGLSADAKVFEPSFTMERPFVERVAKDLCASTKGSIEGLYHLTNLCDMIGYNARDAEVVRGAQAFRGKIDQAAQVFEDLRMISQTILEKTEGMPFVPVPKEVGPKVLNH